MKRLALSAVLLLAVTGCASDDRTARLNVTGETDGTHYTKTFDRAYFAENSGGTDIVLRDGDANDSGPAVRQVVHLRVLWQPTHTIRIDSPSAANAMIDWQVIADDHDRVQYGGHCWANVKVDGDVATVDLRNADVSVQRVIGQVADPLHRASLTGKFIATRSDAQVRSSLDELVALDHGANPTLSSRDVPQATVR